VGPRGREGFGQAVAKACFFRGGAKARRRRCRVADGAAETLLPAPPAGSPRTCLL